MKKMHKRLALVFGAAMAAGCLASCSPPAGGGIEYDFTVSDKTVEYTFFSPGWNNLPTNNDKVLKSLEEKFNIKIKMVGATSTNWQQRLSNLVADNETPDLFFILPNTSTMTDYIKKEVVIDVSTFIEHEKTELAGLDEILKAEPYGENILINGKNYFVPQSVGTTNRVLLVRKDWMKVWNEAPVASGGRAKTGEDVYAEPQTLSEFTSMLTYFHTAGLGTAKNTYGMVMNPDFDFYKDFMATFGVKPDYYTDASGNYQFSALTEEYDEFIEWFKEGDGSYIYPEFYSATEAEMIEAFNRGEVGAILSNGDTMVDGLLRSVEVLNPGESIDDLVTMITPPDSDDGANQGAFMSFNFYWGGWAVSADAKEPMRLVKLLNYLYSEEGQTLLTHGVKDVHYTVTDGVIVPSFDGRNNDGGSQCWSNKKDAATGPLEGRYNVGAQFIPCPFKVENGKLVENYPVETSAYPTWQAKARQITAQNSKQGGLTKIIADPDLNGYNTKIMDAIEQYTISRISGTAKSEAMSLLNSQLSSNKSDKVLKYLNENMK